METSTICGLFMRTKEILPKASASRTPPAPGVMAQIGVSESSGVPNLAGQRPAYLYRELRAYQSGARGDSAMNNAVKFLNDDALVKVAAYFASLDPPQPRPASGTTAFVAKPDAAQAGKTAAARARVAMAKLE